VDLWAIPDNLHSVELGFHDQDMRPVKTCPAVVLCASPPQPLGAGVHMQQQGPEVSAGCALCVCMCVWGSVGGVGGGGACAPPHPWRQCLTSAPPPCTCLQLVEGWPTCGAQGQHTHTLEKKEMTLTEPFKPLRVRACAGSCHALRVVHCRRGTPLSVEEGVRAPPPHQAELDNRASS
jgi:hypothetical protein